MKKQDAPKTIHDFPEFVAAEEKRKQLQSRLDAARPELFELEKLAQQFTVKKDQTSEWVEDLRQNPSAELAPASDKRSALDREIERRQKLIKALENAIAEQQIELGKVVSSLSREYLREHYGEYQETLLQIGQALVALSKANQAHRNYLIGVEKAGFNFDGQLRLMVFPGIDSTDDPNSRVTHFLESLKEYTRVVFDPKKETFKTLPPEPAGTLVPVSGPVVSRDHDEGMKKQRERFEAGLIKPKPRTRGVVSGAEFVQ